MFYGLALAIIGLALISVNTRQLLRAALALMGLLTLSAGLYVMLHAEFLAGVQILVYVGGIVVLIVFAVMLTRSTELMEDHPLPLTRWLGAIISITFMLVSIAALRTTTFPVQASTEPVGDDVRKIGLALLERGATGYLLPFEVISLLLLVALIGGTVVARKTRPTDQPFTTGGDLKGEALAHAPLDQRDAVRKKGGS